MKKQVMLEVDYKDAFELLENRVSMFLSAKGEYFLTDDIWLCPPESKGYIKFIEDINEVKEELSKIEEYFNLYCDLMKGDEVKK